MPDSTPAVRSNLTPAPTPIQTNAQRAAFAPAPEAIAVPAPLTQKGLDGIAPEPQWQNLLCFSSLEEVINTIEHSVKQRITKYQENFEKLLNQHKDDAKTQHVLLKLHPGPQFSWSRVSPEPEIPISLKDLSKLKKALFEGYSATFDVTAKLDDAIAKLPDAIASELQSQIKKIPGDGTVTTGSVEKEKPSILQLEGIWIEFPKTKILTTIESAAESLPSVPKLTIAVSILLSTAPELGPFSVERIHLKFGDSQRDLPT
ncbi:MAG: hypothetical protein EA343_08260 [Nodularia sp. (in: Bacteria)]|nr:MAG: hypothetical protein EA343_08260 [Nodularia sp. (in: cyanobacteria)]